MGGFLIWNTIKTMNEKDFVVCLKSIYGRLRILLVSDNWFPSKINCVWSDDRVSNGKVRREVVNNQ